MGFSLIEAAIVLAIVGLVIGGIWIASASVRENLKMSQLSKNILVIVQNARKIARNDPQRDLEFTAIGYLSTGSTGWNIGLFRGAEGYTLNTNVVDSLGGSSQYSYDDGAAYPAPWGLTAGTRYFGISFTTLTVTQCIKLVTGLSGKFRDRSDLVTILTVAGPLTSFPVSTTEAATSCADPSTVGLVFMT